MEVPRTTTPTRRFPKNSLVLFQGEVPRYGFIVINGCLKVYAIDDEGNEKIVGIYSRGDIFPVDWLTGTSRSVMFYYETIEDSQLMPVQKEECSRRDITEYLHEFASRETTTSLLRNLALQQSNATNKILYFFFYLAMRHGKKMGAGLYGLGLPLTHQFIADNLGLTRETVAGEVSKFKKANVVMYRKKHYVVDKSLLLRTVGKEITSNFTN